MWCIIIGYQYVLWFSYNVLLNSEIGWLLYDVQLPVLQPRPLRYLVSRFILMRLRYHPGQKIIIFLNLQFLDDSIELIKSFLLKQILGKMSFLCRLMECKSFSYANNFDWSLTSPVLLDTRAAAEPSKSRNLAEIVVYKYSAHCSSLDFESECLQRRKKSLSVFVLDSKTKEDNKIVLPPKSGLRN